jgi:S1-C subfamily serine protease
LLGITVACGEGVLATGVPVTAQTVGSDQQLSSQYQTSVFTVNAYINPKETTGGQDHVLCKVGTAFSFGSGEYVITLDSVIEQADKIVVVSAAGEKFDAALLDSNGSISVLRLSSTAAANLPPIGFDTEARPGTNVQMLCLNRLEFSTIPGLIDSVRQKDGTLFIQASASQATSGTPVFSSAGLVGLLALQIDTTRPEQPSPREPATAQRFIVIPGEYAWMVAQSIINNHDRKCGWLGIASDISGMSKTAGAVIRNVIANSPAEKSGLKVNDLITSFEGRDIGSFRNLIESLSSTRPGETAQVTIVRGSQQLSIPVILAPYPDQDLK